MMTASTGLRRATALLLAALALLLPGCSKKSTSPGPQASVSGRVIHVGGRPASGGVDVTLTAITGTLASLDLVVADTLGQFAFTRLSPGTFVLYSRDFADSCDADTVVVPSATSAVVDTLTLRPGGTLTGTATLAGRPDSPGIVLYVDHLLAFAVADSATGAWRLKDVPAGTWVLRATRPTGGFADVTRAVTIPFPGDTVQVAPIQLPVGAPSATPEWIRWRTPRPDARAAR